MYHKVASINTSRLEAQFTNFLWRWIFMSIYVTFEEKIDFLILVTRVNVRDFKECYFLNKYDFITPTWTAGAMLFYSPLIFMWL